MQVFIDRLKWLREKNRYSQREVAEKIDMSLSGYAKIEYGNREPNLETLVKIANLFRESADFLLGIEPYDSVALKLREYGDELGRDFESKKKELALMTMRYEQGNRLESFLKHYDIVKKACVEMEQDFHKSVDELIEYLSTIPHCVAKKTDYY